MNLTNEQLVKLTILIGQSLHRAKLAKLENLPRLQRSVVNQVLDLLSTSKECEVPASEVTQKHLPKIEPIPPL